MQIGLHLQTTGYVRRCDDIIEVLVDLDTGAQVSCISKDWAQQNRLKPYNRPVPKKLGVVGGVEIKSYGAYWVRFTLRDTNGVTREFYRPFVAVERAPDEAPLLLNHAELQQIGIWIHLLPDQTPEWYFVLHRGKPFVREEGLQNFENDFLAILEYTQWSR